MGVTARSRARVCRGSQLAVGRAEGLGSRSVPGAGEGRPPGPAGVRLGLRLRRGLVLSLGSRGLTGAPGYGSRPGPREPARARTRWEPAAARSRQQLLTSGATWAGGPACAEVSPCESGSQEPPGARSRSRRWHAVGREPGLVEA